MTYDARIILGGQGVDVAGAMGQGNALAAQTNALRRDNALAEVYRTQGAGIMAGDQGAMNALAQLDPAQAMGYQQNQLGMEQTRQNMAFSAEEMQMKRDQIKAEAKAWAARQDAATVEAEQAKLTAVLRGASQLHATGDQAGYAAWLQQNGIDPAEYPFEQFPAYAGMFEGVLEAWNEAKPTSPEWVAATPEQASAYGATAGQINTQTGEFKKTQLDKGMIIETMPDGSTRITEGAGVGAGTATSGDALRTSMTDAESVISLIDEIAKDPALPGVTGSLEGGGGNNVDEFSMGRRAYYGDAGLAVVQKIAQLQGNAWLGARALLKGGGAITDYESKKAEGAMARLSRAQGDAEFQAALKDLKDAIRDGMAKLGAGQGSPVAPDQAEIDLLMQGP